MSATGRPERLSAQVSRAEKREGTPMNETRTRLLIVEDDPALQKQMCWAFDQYETIVADDRESALAMVRRHEPAVVTMDSAFRHVRTIRPRVCS